MNHSPAENRSPKPGIKAQKYYLALFSCALLVHCAAFFIVLAAPGSDWKLAWGVVKYINLHLLDEGLCCLLDSSDSAQVLVVLMGVAVFMGYGLIVRKVHAILLFTMGYAVLFLVACVRIAVRYW
ncbi:MAG: hypothetical protein LBP52_05955 [Burkholderiaceae bacterium]|jgi:hypothetical protein|nr:hypothetical protein [Burkholderiaceae bacterium]